MKNTVQPIKHKITIPENLNNMRLDKAAAVLFPDYSRALLQAWIKAGLLTVNGQALKNKEKIKAGQTIQIEATLKKQQDFEPQAIELNIIYEDEHIILLNKPSGLVVHPGAGNPDHTLVNALLNHAPELITLPRAGIVHRLDKNTTGIMVVAKSMKAHTFLVKQIQDRKVKREYEAVTQGAMIAGGTIDAPIARHPINRTKMGINELKGKTAVTHYRVIAIYPQHTHIKVTLQTGRTHQIRVHLAHIRYPIVGDQQYGKKTTSTKGMPFELIDFLKTFKRQALHARYLTLEHPDTHEIMKFEAPLPQDFKMLLSLLKNSMLNV